MLIVLLTMLPLLQPGLALINPNFTPADLVRSSDIILVLEITAPQEGRMTAQVVRTLTGDAPAESTIQIDVTRGEALRPDEVEGAFAGRDHLMAVFFAQEDPGFGEPDGVVRIDTTWFSVRFADDGSWQLDGDVLDVEAVWAGSARQLERAVQRTLEDSDITFPVASALRWQEIVSLGQTAGPATGMLWADMGAPIGRVAMVLSTGGDRLYQVQGGNRPPLDITSQATMQSASHHAAVGDFTGDGRMDIISWDGRELFLAVRDDAGLFVSRAVGVQVEDCRSLAAIEVGAVGHSAVLVGRGVGPPLLVMLEEGRFAVSPLPATDTDLGPGGVSLAADLDGNGHWDVVQAFSRGLVFYSGLDTPGAFAEPVVAPVRLVENPGAILAADYDLDGRIDLLITGETGISLVHQDHDFSWVDATHITGELWRHANATGDRITAVTPADINADGRPGVALMLPDANPMVFFNRGYAVFGLAMDLVLAESSLENAEHLMHGQTAGLMADLTGNGTQDLLTVDPQQHIWLVRGHTGGEPGLWLTLYVPDGVSGPRTVTVTVEDRVAGMYVVRPGVPAVIGCRWQGPVDLSWVEPDGSPAAQQVIVIESTTAVLAP